MNIAAMLEEKRGSATRFRETGASDSNRISKKLNGNVIDHSIHGNRKNILAKTKKSFA